MDKKKLNVAALILVAGGMFVGQFILDSQESPEAKEKQAVQYIAVRNLPDGTLLQKEDFKKVKIPAKAMMENQPQDISKVQGKELKGNLFEGEILTKTRYGAKEKEGDMHVNLTEEMTRGIVKGDFIRIAIQKEENPSVLDVTFKRKQVYENSPEADTTMDANSRFYIKLTEDEAEKYYAAISSGTAIVNKWAETYSGEMEVED